jgi:hypothetical protein
MGRPRKWADNAARQRAYRERKRGDDIRQEHDRLGRQKPLTPYEWLALTAAIGDACVWHLEQGDQKYCDFLARTFRRLARYHRMYHL